MKSSSIDNLHAIFNNQVIKTRNSDLDPVYWYASNEPGPFYVSAENLLGSMCSKTLLSLIDCHLASSNLPGIYKSIHSSILEFYAKMPDYREVISTLLGLLRHSRFSAETVSGGERRDWLFSVPVAHELQVPHIWLRKTLEVFVEAKDGLVIDARSLQNRCVVHVSDILNRGVSFNKYWLPALASVSLKPTYALFAADRSTEYKNVLLEEKIPFSGFIKVDLELFQKAANVELINSFCFEEVRLYLNSPESWIERIFLPNAQSHLTQPLRDPKDAERAARFFRVRGISLPGGREGREID